MASLIINVKHKHIKKCAICKNWYDPTNSAIAPKSPAIGLWEIKDTSQQSLCLKKNLKMPANAFCSSNFELKL